MKHLFIISILFLMYFADLAAQTNANIPSPENVLVVYYRNSTASDSIKSYYQDKRDIPGVNICPLYNFPDTSITIDGVTHTVGIRQGTDIIRDLYNYNYSNWFPTYHAWQYYYTYIAAPIKTYLVNNDLASTIRYIVLCKGVPFKIEAAGDVSANANVTVESLLCLLNTDSSYEYFLKDVYAIFYQNCYQNPYLYTPIISNPYFYGTYGIDPNYDFNWRFSTDAFSWNWHGYTVKLSYLVSHLDGISTEIVEDMIDKSADPDMSGQPTWVLDDDPQISGFSYLLSNTKDKLNDLGFNVNYNNSNDWITANSGDVVGFASKGTHAEDGNCNWEDSAWVVDSLHFSWANGAIYNNLESFNGQSLSTLKWRYVVQGPPNCHHTQGLATQFTEIGGSAFESNGWEPIGSNWVVGLQDIRKTYPAYAMGYNLVNAMYQGIPYFTWVNAIIGDPLTVIAWGKQTTTHNITMKNTNLITGNITVSGGDTLTFASGSTILLKHNGLIESDGYGVLIVESNVTVTSDSWDRGLLLADNHDHPQLIWSDYPTGPANYYKIYKKLDSGSWQFADSVTGHSWTDNSLTYSDNQGQNPNRVYYYVKLNGTQTSNTVDAEVNKSRGKIIPPVLNPIAYKLDQNYPNPFNPTTTVSYSLKNDGFVSLKVYNILGQQVAALVNENQKTGYYSITFNASNFPSGVYIYSISTPGFNASRKMLLIK